MLKCFLLINDKELARSKNDVSKKCNLSKPYISRVTMLPWNSDTEVLTIIKNTMAFICNPLHFVKLGRLYTMVGGAVCVCE